MDNRLLDDDLLNHLLQTFRAEAHEHLENAATLLCQLESHPAGPDAGEQVAELFRLIHSLKGAARAVNLAEVQAVSHELESLLSAVRSGQLRLVSAHFDLLLRSVDGIRRLVELALAGQPADSQVLLLVPELEQAREGRLREKQAPPAPSSVKKTTTGSDLAEDTIRVSVSRVNSLMAQAGELSSARLRIEQLSAEVRELTSLCEQVTGSWLELRHQVHDPAAAAAHHAGLTHLDKRLKQLSRSLARDRGRLQTLTEELQSAIRQLRLLPLDSLFRMLPRLIRDLTREQGKEVTVTVSGGQNTVDKRVLELLKDPLLQLVRNAVDHGVELPQQRLAAGKPQVGAIRISSWQEGNHLLLEVADDGQGIDLDRVQSTALRQGLLEPQQLDRLSRAEMLALILRPGFTTASAEQSLSGRGVGLDVVRRNVDSLHGRVTVTAEEGKGTTILLTIPLTLANTEGVLVSAGGQRFAVPAIAVDRVARIRPEAMEQVGTGLLARIGGERLPAVYLADMLGLPRGVRQAESVCPAVVLTAVAGKVAFLVDDLIGQQELVVKPLGGHLVRVRNVAGATILGSGDPVVVLAPADLVRSATKGAPVTPPAVQLPQAAPAAPHRILVVDDSITTRTLERTILEAAGFHVQTAADGEEAWRILQTERIDLVVTDVEMPRLNGFDLTARMRASEQFAELPVILVTSMASPADRERGIAAGADAYLMKSGFSQEGLLSLVRQFL